MWILSPWMSQLWHPGMRSIDEITGGSEQMLPGAVLTMLGEY